MSRLLALLATALVITGALTFVRTRPHEPCQLGLHSDGTSDWYCGKHPAAPFDTWLTGITR